jgi:hypothetical protein
MPLEDDLIWYLTWRVRQGDGLPAKTRLVKLLYLVDLMNVRDRGEQATSFEITRVAVREEEEAGSDIVERFVVRDVGAPARSIDGGPFDPRPEEVIVDPDHRRFRSSSGGPGSTLEHASPTPGTFEERGAGRLIPSDTHMHDLDVSGSRGREQCREPRRGPDRDHATEEFGLPELVPGCDLHAP